MQSCFCILTTKLLHICSFKGYQKQSFSRRKTVVIYYVTAESVDLLGITLNLLGFCNSNSRQ